MFYSPKYSPARRVSAVFVILLTVAFLLSPAYVRAQARSAMVRETVNDASRVTLAGNTHPQIAHATDLGRLPDETPTGQMTLVLKRSPLEEQALEGYLQSLQDPNSSNYHQWLTPEQFGARWGAVDSDLAAVKSWLESHGFTVEETLPGRTMVEFSGTMGQVRDAFRTEMHAYKVNGEVHHANASDPQIPSALAAMVAGVASLNDFAKHPMMDRGPRGHFDSAANKVRPALTSTAGGDFLYVMPGDAATIYNTPVKGLNRNFAGTQVVGKGVRIGIVGKSNVDASQVAHYRSLFGLPAKGIQVVTVGPDPGQTYDGAEYEAYLDLEVSGGLAPQAQIVYYVAGDTMLNDGIDLASTRAVNDNNVDILSVSWGLCELFLGSSGNAFEYALWKQAAAQGISVVVASGDGGSADCDQGSGLPAAEFGLTVNGLASTPFNVAVGGTEYSALGGPDGSGADFPNYVSLTSAPTTYESALGYIPETPWNISIANFPPTTWSENGGSGYFAGAGGGKSSCVRSTTTSTTYTCLSGYGKPSWQAGAGVPADAARDLPDVSLLADNGFNYATWGICTNMDGDASGNPVSDCVPGSDGLPAGDFYLAGVGGTSASTPAFAGILALATEHSGSRLGQANYVLYNLARQGVGFHDVTTGNIGQPCFAGTPNCRKNAEGNLFTTGWDATAGYDLASGWGSVDATQLVMNWAAAGLNTSATVLTATPTTVEHGIPVTVNVSVTGVPTATGNVALVAEPGSGSAANGVAIGTYPLVSGGKIATLSLNSLPGGSYDLQATYGGSATLSGSTSNAVSVTISPEDSKTVPQVAAYNPISGNPVSLSGARYGLIFQATAAPYGVNSPNAGGVVKPDGIATGKVTFTVAGKTLPSSTLSLSGQAATPTFLLPAGTSIISASYGGDRSFNPSVGQASVTVGKGSTTAVLKSSAVLGKNPITYTVDISTNSAGAGPTGKVSLWELGQEFASGTVVGVAGSGSGTATGEAVITTLASHWGKHPIHAIYEGDGNYNGSTSNTIYVKGRPTFTITGGAFSLTSEHSTGAFYVKLASDGGYLGTVNLTCALTSGGSGAKAPPQCGFEGDAVNLTANSKNQTLFLVYGKGSTLPPGVTAGSIGPWVGGTAVLACCLLVGIPARRRAWRNVLGAVLLAGALFSFTACITQPKFVSGGTYTFTITGVDSKNATNTQTATVVVKVP